MRRRYGGGSSSAHSHSSSSDAASVHGRESSSSSSGSAASSSDGERTSHRDDSACVLSCTVVFDHRFVRLRIATHDTIESLVELTAIKLRKKYPHEDLSHGIVGLRSQRLEKGASIGGLHPYRMQSKRTYLTP